VRAHVHTHKYIRTCVYICILNAQFTMIIYKPQADSPPLQSLELTSQTWSTTNIARLIYAPQLSTTSLVQSRIGNIPLYIYTNTHTHVVGISTCIHVLPTFQILIERPFQQICSPATIIDMLSRRTSGTLRRWSRTSGVQLHLRCVRASSGWTCLPRHR